MTLAVVGLGLLSPFALTTDQHVFFLRAHVPAPPPSPFSTSRGERIDVNYCRWIGPRAPMAERLCRLAERALRDATTALDGKVAPKDARILATTSPPRPGMPESDVVAVSAHLRASRSFVGDAGGFGALKEAQSILARSEAHAVVLCATDSLVAVEVLAEQVKYPPSPWTMKPPPQSKNAAAVTLMDAREARRAGIPILGIIEGMATTLGRSNDDNDEPVDGGAMSVALRELPAGDRVRCAFGPWKVDSLRQNEWHLATARMCDRFHPSVEFHCLESFIGRVGAASGLMNLVYGFAMAHHVATDAVEASAASFVAWAISPDGTRGVARATTKVP